MSNNFKKQAAQQRAAIPQIDPEATKPVVVPVSEPVTPTPPVTNQPIVTPAPVPEPQPAPAQPGLRITTVDTSEMPTNRGFSMYPSRHRQVAKDLAYLEDRNPWQIIEDALEEYIVKHYGKEYKRK